MLIYYHERFQFIIVNIDGSTAGLVELRYFGCFQPCLMWSAMRRGE